MQVKTAAAVIFRNNRFLMIEEETYDGIRINQPAGHVEKGETPEEAAVRETLEEACLNVQALRLIETRRYAGKSKDPSLEKHFERYSFECEILEELPFENHSPEIKARLWLSYEELINQKDRLRSPAVLDSIQAFLKQTAVSV